MRLFLFDDMKKKLAIVYLFWWVCSVFLYITYLLYGEKIAKRKEAISM